MAKQNSGTSMKERAYRHIRSGLAAGQFRPGSQLSEMTIAKEIGVGRTPVREALLVLEHEGFLEQVPRYGTFVKTPGRHERQCMYELREVMESYAASRAAQYMSDSQIRRLKELCEEMLQVARLVRDSNVAPDDLVTRAAIADFAFHMLIIRASGNSLLVKLVADHHLMTRIWGDDRDNRGDPSKANVRDRAISWREHVRIYRAIRDRNPILAAERIREHLNHAAQMALDHYDRQQRLEGLETVGYEWPAAVREAMNRIETLGSDEI